MILELFIDIGLFLAAINVWMIIGYMIVCAPPNRMEPETVFDGFIQSFFWPWMGLIKAHNALERWLDKQQRG